MTDPTIITTDEQIQVKEFLKRAEIRTMRKDLQALREADALKERDKIAKIKTLEEQLEEKKKIQAAKLAEREKLAQLKEVLLKNAEEEKMVEEDLKNYATEAERQQIFVLESQRFDFEKQVDKIDKEREPELKLEKNKLLLQEQNQQAKLNSILEEEKKLETEKRFIEEKEQTTTIVSQKRTLEQSRWDLDKKIQDTERKRWGVEKEINELEKRIKIIDSSLEDLVAERNDLQSKILGINKSLREIYSNIITREEEKRRGLEKERLAKKEELARIRAAEKERIQRQQWTHAGSTPSLSVHQKTSPLEVPIPPKKSRASLFEKEEEERRKFVQDVEQAASKEKDGMQQKSIIK